MSAALAKQLEDRFADKPGHLDHIYIDSESLIRDRHVEHMFEDCFHGRDLDDIFQNNFKLYFEALAARYLPDPQLPPPEVFEDAALARAWVTINFGLIYVGEFKWDDPNRDDEDLAHCTWEAKLRTRVADNVVESCYAPSALHAVLMTVVQVMRHVCHNYHQEMLA